VNLSDVLERCRLESPARLGPFSTSSHSPSLPAGSQTYAAQSYPTQTGTIQYPMPAADVLGQPSPSQLTSALSGSNQPAGQSARHAPGSEAPGGGGRQEPERRKRQPCSFFLKTGNCAFGSE
jgi:hypothetical protein